MLYQLVSAHYVTDSLNEVVRLQFLAIGEKWQDFLLDFGIFLMTGWWWFFVCFAAPGLVPEPGTEPGPPAMGTKSLSHCATREIRPSIKIYEVCLNTSCGFVWTFMCCLWKKWAEYSREQHNLEIIINMQKKSCGENVISFYLYVMWL